MNETAETVPTSDRRCGHSDNTRTGSPIDHARWAKLKASVRPLVVVVAHVLVENTFKVTSTQISIQSRHSCRTVRTHRSANALAFGAWTGVLMTWTPSAAKTLSKARVNLLSRSRMRNRGALVPAVVSSSRRIESSLARWTTQAHSDAR